jgi:hypothetical protein
MKDWGSPIPKDIHLIWIGGSQPDYFKYFLQSFQKHMSEFQIRIWNNNDLTRKNFPKTINYIKKTQKLHGKNMKNEDNEKMFDENMNPLLYNKFAQITDLMRLEIIFNHGGFYFDTTFEILKPMYNLLNKKKYKFIGCNEVPRFKDHNILSNSFFGATKGNVILKRLLSKKKLDKIDFYDFAVDFQTGPGYLRSGIRLSDNYKILPTHYLYPFVEEYLPGKDPPYRKSSKNKCHKKTFKKKPKSYRRLKNKKGYIQYPCKKYPNSYSLKHWQLGKSWLIVNYYV